MAMNIETTEEGTSSLTTSGAESRRYATKLHRDLDGLT